MLISTKSEDGIIRCDVTNRILNDPSVQNQLINNKLQIMRTKGFYGINIYLDNITSENANSIVEYLEKSSERFRQEGYIIMITITLILENFSIDFEKGFYTECWGVLKDYTSNIQYRTTFFC